EWLCTVPSEGYGGREFKIKMRDGREALLRGPWHIGVISPYISVTMTPKDSWERPNVVHAVQQPWWRSMGFFGLGIHQDLWMKLILHFTDVKRIVWAKPSYMKDGWLEPVHPDWGKPKALVERAVLD